MDLNDILMEALSQQASDVHIKEGAPPIFRVNVFQQRGKLRIALRIVPYQIRGPQDLHLPSVIANIALEQRGLILVTGTTGSGKSTTLASMIDIVNSERNCHILTVEDPIEVVHEDKKAII